MYLPVLRAITTSEIYVSGDVTIDDTAIIAPGVILQAAPGTTIVIKAGVCIGLGAIIKASQGNIEIKENAIVGAGVLVIGESKINSQVCLGTCTTVYNTSVDAMTIIPAGSVLGDPSRSIKIASSDERDSSPQLSSPSDKKNLETQEEQIDSSVKTPLNEPKEKDTTIDEVKATETKEVNDTLDVQADIDSPTPLEEDPWETRSNNINKDVNKDNENPVVGQVYIKNLLFTLFPDKQ